jgi:hypothetical protein
VLAPGDGRYDVDAHNNQSTQEKQASDNIEEADFAESIRSGKVLWMKCDLEESTPPAKGLYVRAPRQARDKEATHKEQNSHNQQKKVQNDVHVQSRHCPMHAA